MSHWGCVPVMDKLHSDLPPQLLCPLPGCGCLKKAGKGRTAWSQAPLQGKDKGENPCSSTNLSQGLLLPSQRGCPGGTEWQLPEDDVLCPDTPGEQGAPNLPHSTGMGTQPASNPSQPRDNSQGALTRPPPPHPTTGGCSHLWVPPEPP